MEQEQLREVVAQTFQSVQGDGYLIIRAEKKREWGMRFNNGKLDRVSTGREEGMGVQAFTREGVGGFASADMLSGETGRMLAGRAMSLAARNEKLGAAGNKKIFQAIPRQDISPNPAGQVFDDLSLSKIEDRVLALHRDLIESAPELVWQTSYRQVEDTWCIGRSDGTLVSFVIPRAVLMHQGTVHTGGKSASTLIHRNGTDGGLILEEQADHALLVKALERSDFAKKVCNAPELASGHYPLVIDYGLAKGLAHEAFGHAVESDHMGESVLGEQGKLRRGLKVARPGVQIVDGPLEGDWAYQPFSANGLIRETVHIVRNGVLEAGLGDIFSAEDSGMPVSGAGRAENYAHVPLPRMSNIRLLVDDVVPLPDDGFMAQVRQIRKELLGRGEMVEGQKVLLLVGYRGGQVNPKTGDFVFQSEGIIDLGDDDFPVYRPSIFSGKILSALQAIKIGFGGARYDAIGTCGKNGQAVPSSGGSNSYLFLEKDPLVSLGGTIDQ